MPVTIDDVLTTITQRLEAGVLPWRQPWAGGSRPSRPLRADGESFSGSNLLILSMMAAARGYVSPYWLTFPQARDVGGRVRKGEGGTPALLFKTRVVEDERGGSVGEDRVSVRKYSKVYYVFNGDQIDDLPERYSCAPSEDPMLRNSIRDAALEAVPAKIVIGGAHAAYDARSDLVRMPPPEVFASADDYRATLWHELAHWTGAEGRLGRQFGGRFGDAAYAFEELVAEFASVLLGFTLGVSPTLIDGHASYIDHWAKLLAARPHVLLEAAGHAQKAVDHLLAYRADARKEAAVLASPAKALAA